MPVPAAGEVVFAAVPNLPSQWRHLRGSSSITLETEHDHELILVAFASRTGGSIDDGDHRRRLRGSGDIGSLWENAVACRIHSGDLRGAASVFLPRRGAISVRKRQRDDENDDRYGHSAVRRRRQRFRCDDDAASPRRHRDGAGRAAIRTQRATQAHGAGDHRDPATGNRGDAAGAWSTVAAVGALARPGTTRRTKRLGIHPPHEPGQGAVT